MVEDPNSDHPTDRSAPGAVDPNSDHPVPFEAVETTPAAQATAEDVGVDVSTVQGTGKGGKVTKADVEAAAPE
jgi:pyruvate/2-oxoglutarate dehydrogenase complex dihydrolipoamide acyltransferase (E2) component